MTRLIDFRTLTRAERLVVARRRDEVSQADAAAQHGVSVDTYKRWETGRYQGPMVAIGRLLPHEECFLLRRRATMSRSELARAIGKSRQWTTLMERGREPAHHLVTYWRERAQGRRDRRD